MDEKVDFTYVEIFVQHDTENRFIPKILPCTCKTGKETELTAKRFLLMQVDTRVILRQTKSIAPRNQAQKMGHVDCSKILISTRPNGGQVFLKHYCYYNKTTNSDSKI